MSGKIYIISDTHFGHGNIIKFTNDKGEVIRQHPEGRLFKNVREHDELLIQYWNETVTPQDHVYHLGDFAISKQVVKFVGPRLLGKKRLVRGNHDIAETKEYINAGFKEVYGVRVFHQQKLILSHIPIHPRSLKPGWVNIHGHLHSNVVRLDNGQPDDRYRCVSVEHTEYKPVYLMEASEASGEKKHPDEEPD